MSSPFSTKHTQPLPPSMKAALSKKKKLPIKPYILDALTKSQEPLTVDQIWVGIYKLYGVEVTRLGVFNCLHRLTKSKQVHKCIDLGVAKYTLPEATKIREVA